MSIACQVPMLTFKNYNSTWNLQPSPKMADQMKVQTVEPSREMYVFTYLGGEN